MSERKVLDHELLSKRINGSAFTLKNESEKYIHIDFTLKTESEILPTCAFAFLKQLRIKNLKTIYYINTQWNQSILSNLSKTIQ